MTLQIWIPQSAREKWLECGLPGCGRKFPLTQRPQFERHVKACMKRNGDRLEAHVAKREELHGDADFDRELYDHLRAGGS